ncbi:MAG: PaaD-like protein (DUF59) involved in Fe-S cluster assembly, partial [uncultured Acetobacteraceae bacterium]
VDSGRRGAAGRAPAAERRHDHLPHQDRLRPRDPGGHLRAGLDLRGRDSRRRQGQGGDDPDHAFLPLRAGAAGPGRGGRPHGARRVRRGGRGGLGSALGPEPHERGRAPRFEHVL